MPIGIFITAWKHTSLWRYYTVCLRNIFHKTSCCTAVDNNFSPDAASSKALELVLLQMCLSWQHRNDATSIWEHRCSVVAKIKEVQINWITWKVSRHNIVIIHDWERMLNRHPRFLEIHCRRGGRSRGRKSHLTRSLVASEGWSLVRDRTNRKQCPSHKTWSYKRDGRWWGWSFDRGSTVCLKNIP